MAFVLNCAPPRLREATWDHGLAKRRLCEPQRWAHTSRRWRAPVCLSTEGTATMSTGASSDEKVSKAVEKAVKNASGTVPPGVTPTIALFFVSLVTERQAETAFRALKKSLAMCRWNPGDIEIVGCSGDAVFAGQDGNLDEADIGVSVSFLTGVKGHPFCIRSDLMDLSWRQTEWKRAIGYERDDNPAFLLFNSPDNAATDQLLSGLDFAFPTSTKAGAMISAINPAQFFVKDTVLPAEDALLGLVLDPSTVNVDVVVSQASRALGPVLLVNAIDEDGFITKVSEEGTVTSAEGSPMTLFNMWRINGVLSDEDGLVEADALLAGVASTQVASAMEVERTEDAIARTDSSMNSQDFVTRKILASDQKSGAIAVQGGVREGQYIQFRVAVYDEESVQNYLKVQLDRHVLEASARLSQPDVGGMASRSLCGALIFADRQSERRLDVELVNELFDRPPICGLLSLSQLGPIFTAAGQNQTVDISASVVVAFLYSK